MNIIFPCVFRQQNLEHLIECLIKHVTLHYLIIGIQIIV